LGEGKRKGRRVTVSTMVRSSKIKRGWGETRKPINQTGPRGGGKERVSKIVFRQRGGGREEKGSG